jgi:uncharacterized protein
MNCPACQHPMIVLELDQIEIDYCSNCHGVWLDSGELELLLGDADEKKRRTAAFTPAPPAAETSRKCPYCRKKMNKILTGPPHGVCLDRCPRDHGLWFDAGELQRVLEKAHYDPKDKVLNLLRNMMGKNDSHAKGETS